MITKLGVFLLGIFAFLLSIPRIPTSNNVILMVIFLVWVVICWNLGAAIENAAKGTH